MQDKAQLTAAEQAAWQAGLDEGRAQAAANQLATQHPDDAAVDALTTLMKAKLAKQRDKGYGGWDDTECSQQHLSNLLRGHVEKGDPVDVANFCAFLSARGEGIAAAVCKQPKFAVQTGSTMTLHFADDAAALAFYRATKDGITPAMAPQAAPAAVAVPDDALQSIRTLLRVAKNQSNKAGMAHAIGLVQDELEKVAVRAALAATPAAWAKPVSELLGHISDVLPDNAFDKIDTKKWNAVSALVGAATPAAAAPVVLPEPDFQLKWSASAGRYSFSKPITGDIDCYTADAVRALLAGVSAPAALAVERGEVLVTVSGFTGSGKSAIAGEIEIMCRALGLQVEWPDSDSEKHMTHADWIAALEQYKPRVRIVECNVPHSVVKGQDK